MSKILTINDMLELLDANPKMEGRTEVIAAIEEAATKAASLIASHYGIGNRSATWEGSEFAGIAASFFPISKGDPCPDPINNADPEGDWEF